MIPHSAAISAGLALADVVLLMAGLLALADVLLVLAALAPAVYANLHPRLPFWTPDLR